MEDSCSRTDPATVLVVDDDLSMRLLAGQSLEIAGFRVVEAENGAAALALVEEVRPALVLLDVEMPAMDGFSVCSRLREFPATRDLPVLMMTGLDDVQSINRAYEVGATDFITKPPNWIVLGHRVRYMIRASESAATLRRTAENLHRSEAKLLTAQRMANLGWWEWDAEKQVFEGSEEFSLFLGPPSGDPASGLETLLCRVHDEDRGSLETLIQSALQTGQAFGVEHRIVRPDGAVRIVHHQTDVTVNDEGDVTRVTGTIQDITERKQDEKKIRHLAYFDSLTGLPNRWLLADRLALAIETARRHQGLVGVLFVDLDQFKRINDTLGHSVGDELLRCVGERLQAMVRSTDCLARVGSEGSEAVVARLGGDEFIIVLSEIRHVRDAAMVAQRVLDALTLPFALHSQEVFSTGSVGISVYPYDGDDIESLLKNADAAMYHAKEKGRNNFQFYTGSMNAKALERLVLENRLRKALANEEFVVHYQPQVEVGTGRIIGAEALLRWPNPEVGLIPPLDFIPVAEETGLIVPIGEWVLREACMQGGRWREGGFPAFRMAVNVSGRQFHEEDFVSTVSSVLSETGFPPENLELELTESVVMKDVETTVEFLKSLNEMGVRLSVDDFGTGYSSMSYLRQFPLNVLKIDRSFMKGIPTNLDNAAIVTAIIAMATSLKLEVIAEGVELQEQEKFLNGINCSGMQGYLISPAVSTEKFQELLDNCAAVVPERFATARAE